MHRATPHHSSLRGFSAGGSRATIPEVDDSKFMQESMGNFLKNEARKAIEAPQNYGFTSVVTDAIKDGMGKILSCAESFVQYMGGNQSFPVLQNMDDRRHRLWGLEKGDTAIFRQATDFLQSHLNKDGLFHTGPRDKTVRMQLIDQDSGQQQQGGQQGGQRGTGPAGTLTFFDLMPDMRDPGWNWDRVSSRDGDGGGGGGGSAGGQEGQGSNQGQKAIYKKGQESYRFVDVTKDKTTSGGKNVHLDLDDKKTYVHCQGSDKHVYLGAEAGKGTFDYVITLSGPCVNTKGKYA